MVDEVEDILREIADRVRAEQNASLSQVSTETLAEERPITIASEPSAKTSLGRIESYLTTTGRAWDRLPPVFSNRSGAIARLELWIKRFFKRSTRWYAWEQVNFNAAVHHALSETLTVLSNLTLQLENVRQEMQAERETIARRTEAELQKSQAQIDIHRKETELRQKELQQQIEKQLESQAQQIIAQQERFESLTALLSDLTKEVRERSDNLTQEQRVSFKQLALEISEIATLADRNRREIQTRLEQLKKGASRT
ncbi:MAG TPA: hypothetical protein VIG25_09165 [Pyrinomonadaceae bacterium]